MTKTLRLAALHSIALWILVLAAVDTQPVNGLVYQITQNCVLGATLCFGARQSSNGYWGVDIDNSSHCAACCFTCGNGNPITQNLTCN